MFFVFALFSLSFAASKECSSATKNTQFYRQNSGDKSASKSTPVAVPEPTFFPSSDTVYGGDKFFLQETSPLVRSLHPSEDKCEVSDIKKDFSLPPGYEVQYIVDKASGPEHLSSCSKEIMGNVIVVSRKWNRQISQLCWKYSEKEKRLVYGDQVVDFALASVEECCNLIKPISKGAYITLVVITSTLSLIILSHLLLTKLQYKPYLDKIEEVNIFIRSEEDF